MDPVVRLNAPLIVDESGSEIIGFEKSERSKLYNHDDS